jgi:hypothetical protein
MQDLVNMASMDAAKALLGIRTRPQTTRPIVPAIPLPYIQKRKQHAATPTKVEGDHAAALTIETPTSSSPPPTAANGSLILTNGSTDGIKLQQPSGELTPVSPVTPTVENELELGNLREQEPPAQAPVEGEF